MGASRWGLTHCTGRTGVRHQEGKDRGWQGRKPATEPPLGFAVTVTGTVSSVEGGKSRMVLAAPESKGGDSSAGRGEKRKKVTARSSCLGCEGKRKEYVELREVWAVHGRKNVAKMFTMVLKSCMSPPNIICTEAQD